MSGFSASFKARVEAGEFNSIGDKIPVLLVPHGIANPLRAEISGRVKKKRQNMPLLIYFNIKTFSVNRCPIFVSSVIK